MGTVSTTLPSDGQTIDASDVNTPINAILSEFNGNIDNDNIKTGANINGAKLLASSLPGSSFDTTLAGGWISGGLPAYSSATNNGNKSYDIVFASTVASLLSPGMRLRTTRTVTAPTQCTDLEASSSQYFSATSASLAGVTFTDDFTCMGWVKLESYAGSDIISRESAAGNGWALRVNSSGQVVIFGANGGAYDINTSYQSIPLGKWVHIAATLNMSAATSEIYIDGVLVPSTYTNSGATTLVQGTDLTVGRSAASATLYMDGKLAQVAVFSSVLSASTIRSYMSQGLSGSESTLVSAFSCNNSLLDLNTTNNNDLTANGGALMTATDSPFGQDSNGVTAGTTDYALVMKVSTTTATVQVPEGCTIPTSGGVSAVAYSTATSPFGFTLDKGRWEVGSILLTDNATTSNATYGAFMVGGFALTVPIGSWEVGIRAARVYNTTTTTVLFAVSKTALTGLAANAINSLTTLVIVTKSAGAAETTWPANINQLDLLDTASTYVMYTQGATTGAGIASTVGQTKIYAIPAGI